ncbi:MAG: 4-hydroxy-tetrahydrodipicolinate reductase [Chloroflexi bacterium]|nr:4-hydroxy-tetrahydrodipicolinate reductase [Chloroflexota bacterium]
MKRTKVLVHGVLGRMGQEVLRAVCRDPELEAVAGVDIKGAMKDLSLPDGSGSIPFSSNLESMIKQSRPDVMVDFTNAEATILAARTAIKHGVALVIGTTGISNADLKEIEDLCRKRKVGAVVAPNFAIAGVLMMHLAKISARFFDYAEIIELHHEQKLDAPSGTAIATARDMREARGKDFIHTAAKKENVTGSRGGELGGIALHAVRMPGLLAHQEVILGAPGQTLRIRLDQINREAFMPGVTLAIKKAVELKEAVFGLDKLLGI